jgi:phage terminase small subunit
MAWVSKSEGLDFKRKLFCEEYAALGFKQAFQAAINAGFASKSSRSKASQLLDEPAVEAYVEELKTLRLHDAQIRAEDLIIELKAVAFSNGSDFAEIRTVIEPKEEGGEIHHREVVFKPFNELPPHKLKAVAEVGERRTKWGSQVYVRTHDKLGAIRQLREMGGFTAPTEINQNINAQVKAETTVHCLKRKHRRPNNESNENPFSEHSN